MQIRKISLLTFCSILVLSACTTHSAQPKPTNRESTETSTGASESPESTLASSSASYAPGNAEGPARNVPFPTMPKEAMEFSEDGAESFTLYYFDLLNYAIDTSDVTAMKKLTEDDCTVCHKQIIKEAEKTRDAHRWQVGGKHHPKVVDSYISGKDIAIVTVEYTSEVGNVYSAPNTVHEKVPKQEDARLAFDLSYDRGWTVHKIMGAD